MSLRFLPPGFELDRFAIHDDPAFSAEPMLRSDAVVANLRITRAKRLADLDTLTAHRLDLAPE